jgi:hypothetical protein
MVDAAQGSWRGTALVFARTETSWFVQQVWPEQRLYFLDERTSIAPPENGQRRTPRSFVLVAYGGEDARMLREVGSVGTYCDLWRSMVAHTQGWSAISWQHNRCRCRAPSRRA